MGSAGNLLESSKVHTIRLCRQMFVYCRAVSPSSLVVSAVCLVPLYVNVTFRRQIGFNCFENVETLAELTVSCDSLNTGRQLIHVLSEINLYDHSNRFL